MIILWVTKDFSGTPGWEIIFHERYISDGTVAILCGVLPLILPNANPLNGKLEVLKKNFRRYFRALDFRGLDVSTDHSMD